MPNLIHCHECDKPTANSNGICDNCETSFIEGSGGNNLSGLKQLEDQLSHVEGYFNKYKLALYDIADYESANLSKEEIIKNIKEIAKIALDPFSKKYKKTSYTIEMPMVGKDAISTTHKNIDSTKWVSPQDPGDEYCDQQSEILEYDRSFYEEEE